MLPRSRYYLYLLPCCVLLVPSLALSGTFGVELVSPSVLAKKDGAKSAKLEMLWAHEKPRNATGNTAVPSPR